MGAILAHTRSKLTPTALVLHEIGDPAGPGFGRHHWRVLDALADLVARGGVVVVSGAGLSTESGIPDYRGPSGAARRPHAPMTHQAFVHDPIARRRYWARSHMGWGLMAHAVPNAGHLAVTRLEELGCVRSTITQNVDGLHSAAGTRHVIDLHGRLDRVVCLDCKATSGRSSLAHRLARANPTWRAEASAVNPDGDVEVAEEVLEDFVVVDCAQCGGTLMPDVVYFGGTVPPERVAAAFDEVEQARALLVLGSSLTVYSGRRFVVAAAKAGTPVAIVNEGPTRGDEYAEVKLEAPLGATLQDLVARLVGQ
jgi:NAD-dependent SIR2 family protein deacetylase